MVKKFKIISKEKDKKMIDPFTESYTYIPAAGAVQLIKKDLITSTKYSLKFEVKKLEDKVLIVYLEGESEEINRYIVDLICNDEFIDNFDLKKCITFKRKLQ